MIRIITLIIYVLIFSASAFCSNISHPTLFLFLGGDKASSHEKQLDNPYVTGAQIIYSWRDLEPKRDVYDFSKIEEDLRFLTKSKKKLFIQLQDRSFEPTVFNVPNYIREDEIFHGGVAMQYDFPGEGQPINTGWVARVWDPAVQKRFQKLIRQLAEQFDGRIDGINLPETSVDFDPNNPPKDFTDDKYFYAELNNIAFTRNVFHKSLVMQYVNFFPGEWNNDRHYMSRFFSYAAAHRIGLGGPDVVPYQKSQMKSSYAFFHKMKDKIITGMAVQEPDYTYRNPETGEFYTFEEFYKFSTNYLGAKIIFWNVQEPFFSNELEPNLSEDNFELCHSERGVGVRN